MDARLLLAFALAASPVALAAPPVPMSDAAVFRYEYRGPEASGEYTVDDLLALIRAAPAGVHEVRGGPDAEDWTPWNKVPTLAMAWLAPQGVTVYHYARGAGEPERLTGPEIAARVKSSPDAEHLVWKTGMTAWTDARSVPTLALLMGTAPPPLPATIAPPARPPVAPVAVAPPPPPAPAPVAASSPLHVAVGGDVRIDLTGAHLERLGGGAAGSAAIGFNVSRARPVIDAALGDWFSGRLAVEFRQDDGTTAYTSTGLTLDVQDWAAGWSVQGREIYLQADIGGALRQRVRIGLQEPAFGAREAYEARYPFAGESRADLGRRTGLLADEDLGVGWRGELDDRWAFDVQLLNGSGGASLDQNNGKDFLARAAATPVDALTVSLSGLYGARGLDGTGAQAQAALTVEVTGTNQRLLVEGLAGTTTEDRLDTVYMGAAASGAWRFPVARGPVDYVEAVGRFQFYDPVAGFDQPDAWWAPAAGAWIGWDVHPAHVVRLGATWEMYVPQDSLLPVEHDVVAEAAWVF